MRLFYHGCDLRVDSELDHELQETREKIRSSRQRDPILQCCVPGDGTWASENAHVPVGNSNLSTVGADGASALPGTREEARPVP